jgi:hypothetical protein
MMNYKDLCEICTHNPSWAAERIQNAEARSEKAEAKLAALGKDARLVAQAGLVAAQYGALSPEELAAACRILDATEGGK